MIYSFTLIITILTVIFGYCYPVEATHSDLLFGQPTYAVNDKKGASGRAEINISNTGEVILENFTHVERRPPFEIKGPDNKTYTIGTDLMQIVYLGGRPYLQGEVKEYDSNAMYPDDKAKQGRGSFQLSVRPEDLKETRYANLTNKGMAVLYGKDDKPYLQLNAGGSDTDGYGKTRTFFKFDLANNGAKKLRVYGYVEGSQLLSTGEKEDMAVHLPGRPVGEAYSGTRAAGVVMTPGSKRDTVLYFTVTHEGLKERTEKARKEARSSEEILMVDKLAASLTTGDKQVSWFIDTIKEGLPQFESRAIENGFLEGYTEQNPLVFTTDKEEVTQEIYIYNPDLVVGWVPAMNPAGDPE